ncbi:MAG: hypothetical protein WCR29_06355 [Bacteroidales bacterium]
MELTKKATLKKLKKIKDVTFIKKPEEEDYYPKYLIWYKGMKYILTVAPDCLYLNFSNNRFLKGNSYLEINNVDFLIVLFKLGYLEEGHAY